MSLKRWLLIFGQVSDGAELVMLSKKVFTSNANEQVRQYVRKHVTFLPEDSVLQENLQTEVDWKHFRYDEIRRTKTRLLLSKSAV